MYLATFPSMPSQKKQVQVTRVTWSKACVIFHEKGGVHHLVSSDLVSQIDSEDPLKLR